MEDILVLIAVVVFMVCGAFYIGKIDSFLKKNQIKQQREVIALENSLLYASISFLKNSSVQFEICDDQEKMIQKVMHHQIDFAILTKPVYSKNKKLKIERLLLPIENFDLYNEIYVAYPYEKVSPSLKLLFERCSDSHHEL